MTHIPDQPPRTCPIDRCDGIVRPVGNVEDYVTPKYGPQPKEEYSHICDECNRCWIWDIEGLNTEPTVEP